MTNIYVGLRQESYGEDKWDVLAIVIKFKEKDLDAAHLFFNQYRKMYQTETHLRANKDVTVYIDIPSGIHRCSKEYGDFLKIIVEIYNNTISGKTELNPEFVMCNSCLKQKVIRIEDKFNGLNSWVKDEGRWYCCSKCLDKKGV